MKLYNMNHSQYERMPLTQWAADNLYLGVCPPYTIDITPRYDTMLYKEVKRLAFQPDSLPKTLLLSGVTVSS